MLKNGQSIIDSKAPSVPFSRNACRAVSLPSQAGRNQPRLGPGEHPGDRAQVRDVRERVPVVRQSPSGRGRQFLLGRDLAEVVDESGRVGDEFPIAAEGPLREIVHGVALRGSGGRRRVQARLDGADQVAHQRVAGECRVPELEAYGFSRLGHPQPAGDAARRLRADRRPGGLPAAAHGPAAAVEEHEAHAVGRGRGHSSVSCSFAWNCRQAEASCPAFLAESS